jgi:methylated-DNA-[protein]-cysteine S-methyltransferase
MSHACIATPFGVLTVFADDDALVALEWGRAASEETTPLLQDAIEQLGRYFDGDLRCFDLPLRPSGSAFQRRAWDLMATIPYAATRTYGDLAHELGTSPRALAGACAGNPLPIIVPCHRVVAAHGQLGGYSGGDGIDTKRALLRLEGATFPPAPLDLLDLNSRHGSEP